MNTKQQKVINYFSGFGSRLGYNFILGGVKHFGYYPNKRPDISEKEAQNLLQDFVGKKLGLKPNQQILDAGCGQGIVATYLASKFGADITGITIVPFEVEEAKNLAQKLGLSQKTKFSLMDYSNTKFKDKTFDGIYTTETLSHSPNIRKTLKEFFRILKPGGKFVFSEYTIAQDRQFTNWEKKILELVIEGSAMMGLKDFRHDEFTKVLENAGFENVKEENMSKNMEPSVRRLRNLSVLPYLAIRIFHLQKFFINTTAAFEFYKMGRKGLFRHCLFTGTKPKR